MLAQKTNDNGYQPHTRSAPEPHTAERQPSQTRHRLDQQLAHSLELEAAMFQLQKQFLARSRTISDNVSQLGRMLGVRSDSA